MYATHNAKKQIMEELREKHGAGEVDDQVIMLFEAARGSEFGVTLAARLSTVGDSDPITFPEFIATFAPEEVTSAIDCIRAWVLGPSVRMSVEDMDTFAAMVTQLLAQVPP